MCKVFKDRSEIENEESGQDAFLLFATILHVGEVLAAIEELAESIVRATILDKINKPLLLFVSAIFPSLN